MPIGGIQLQKVDDDLVRFTIGGKTTVTTSTDLIATLDEADAIRRRREASGGQS